MLLFLSRCSISSIRTCNPFSFAVSPNGLIVVPSKFQRSPNAWWNNSHFQLARSGHTRMSTWTYALLIVGCGIANERPAAEMLRFEWRRDSITGVEGGRLLKGSQTSISISPWDSFAGAAEFRSQFYQYLASVQRYDSFLRMALMTRLS